ncbi:MAG TPA: metal-dependent hydrolase, partial [Chitinophagaceae bacterium]|nr:metal-dependent hydrolase [Chitinophagaceae bacterium]
AIALRTGAVVIASYEVHEWLNQRGVTQTHPMNTGGKRNFGPLTVKCVVAHHSSSLPDGTYGGNPMGFLIELGGTSFYYSGDTSLTLDMQLIPAWMQPSFAVMPIGDNFTMGLQDALKACEFCKTTQLIGVHFNTFGYITIDEAGSVAMAREAGIKLILPRIGETLDL